MRIAMFLAAAAMIAGCASPLAYSELQSAEQRLKQHASADMFMDLDLIDKGATTAEQRATDITARKDHATHCGAEFHKAFVALVDEAPSHGSDALIFAIGRAQQLENEYDRCVAPFGLTGYPEFKVGESYLRTPAFVRSWVDAATRVAQAKHLVDSQSQSNLNAFALGLAMRPPTPVYVAPPPSITVRQPINCRSTRDVLGAVNTTCH